MCKRGDIYYVDFGEKKMEASRAVSVLHWW